MASLGESLHLIHTFSFSALSWLILRDFPKKICAWSLGWCHLFFDPQCSWHRSHRWVWLGKKSWSIWKIRDTFLSKTKSNRNLEGFLPNSPPTQLNKFPGDQCLCLWRSTSHPRHWSEWSSGCPHPLLGASWRKFGKQMWSWKKRRRNHQRSDPRFTEPEKTWVSNSSG